MPPHHPHHHHHRYADQYWKDMPEKAHKAALALGYTAESWDADARIPYDDKTFFQCTLQEKQAAMFLGMSPIDSKLQVWWSELDQPTKDAALAIGWTQQLWDDDWEIEHLPCNEWWWDKDMDKKQQKAANHFGYTKATWDETYDEVDFKKPNRFANANKKQEAASPKKQSKQGAATQQKVENEEEEPSKDKFSFLDNVCCAPYKLVLMPVTKLAKVLAK